MFKLWFVKLREKLGLVIYLSLMLSCIYNYIKSPHFMCILYKCNNSASKVMIGIFPRAVAVACIISKTTSMYKNVNAIFKYTKKIEKYETNFPLNASKQIFRRGLFMIIVIVLTALILPINAYRLYLINHHFQDTVMNIFFILIYIQNASMCLTEVQFFVHCFGLYQKFQSINEDMSVLKLKTILINRYPLILKPDEHNKNRVDTNSTNFSPGIKEFTLSYSIELLKMRHQFVSDSVADLNELYDIQLGISLSIVFIMALFDTYEVLFYGLININETIILFYGWLFQYGLRFCMITLTTHITTKQAHKSKTLLTDINNRHIDNTTKEEIRLFLNEVSNRSVEFTTFDLAILNMRIITSAIVVGTTYLVILLQFR